MINKYAMEQLAAADHAERLQQAHAHRCVRRAHTTQRPVTWWRSLSHVWRTLQEHIVALVQSDVYEANHERR